VEYWGKTLFVIYTTTLIAIKGVIPAPIFVGINSSRNPGKYWILGQARDDKPLKPYAVE
jgi:hypothetical protein